MSVYLREVTPPTAEPLTLQEAMEHMNIELDDRHKDEWILRAIKRARLAAEQFLNFSLVDSVWEYRIDRFATVIPLPLGYVGEISSITYIDEDGAEQTLDASVYVFDDNPLAPVVRLAFEETWPTTRAETNAVRIQFQGIHSETNSPPNSPSEDIKGAMGMMIAFWDRNREAASGAEGGALLHEVPYGAMFLLQPYRLGMGV